MLSIIAGLHFAVAACGVGGDEIIVTGDKLALAFSRDNYSLTSFVGRNGFGEIVADREALPSPLWRIDMRSGRGLDEKLSVDAGAKCRRSHSTERTADGQVLKLTWQGLDVGNEKAALDVTATVRIPKGSSMAFWTIAVENRSLEFGVWEYFYPMIQIAPPDEQLEKNYFVNTFRMGEVVADPFRVKPLPSGKRMFEYSRTLSGTKGTGQFTAFYGANGRGFFFGSRDPEGWEKNFIVTFRPQEPAVRIEMMHVPLNLGFAGEDHEISYPVVTGLFRGDWYDACQVYRRWAVEQPWCGKGPLASRDDVPRWLKDCCMMLRQDTKGDAGKGPDNVVRPEGLQTQNNRQNVLRCLEVFGKPMASIWYAWWIKDKDNSQASLAYLKNKANGNDGQLVAPLPGVADLNRQITAEGCYPLAYSNAILYDMGDEQDFLHAEHAAERDERGRLRVYPPEKAACRMCRFAPWWQERYAEICRRAITECGFKGVYWDSFGKDAYRCFQTDHGHSYGGGSKVIQGERAFGEYVRRAIKQADPEAVTSAEASSPEFLDLVDLRLCAMSIRPNVAPIFSCIYHDYQLFYGRRLVLSDPTPVFSMTAGYLFNMGGILGRYGVSSSAIDYDTPENAVNAAFFKSLVEAKRSAREFLNTGRMMRPPTLLTDVPRLTATIWYNEQVVALPAVLSSSWRSTAGDIAVVFVNCDTRPHEFAYRIDTVEYGFPRDTTIDRFDVTQQGRRAVGAVDSGIVEETLTLPGHCIKILVLSGES